MYMNVNGILAAQRPGAGLAGPTGGALGPASRGARRPRRARLAGLSCLPARASRPHARPQGSGSAWAALCGCRPAAPVHVCPAPLGRAWERTPSLPDPGMIRGVVPRFHRIYVAWLPWS
jgi:hypothetical protein